MENNNSPVPSFLLFARQSIAGLFLRQHDLLLLTTEFLSLMAVSNPIFGLSNLVTTFYQALGKPGPSLLITLLRNMILYLPALILFNHFFWYRRCHPFSAPGRYPYKHFCITALSKRHKSIVL
ncbi:MAG: hypothetical protein LLG02_05130 [Pelosinus sp.]|nr:hypothetical protein [Pelosinus sp.]